MSKLSKLLGKEKEVVIGGETFSFKPLTVDHLDLVMDLEVEGKRAGAMKKIVELSLRGAVPDATDEEIKGVAMEHFKGLSDAIMEVNNLGGE